MINNINAQEVYVITYLPTGKKYVGKSNNVKARFENHVYSLRRHGHSNIDFQQDFDKYGGGFDSFKLEVVDYQFPLISDRFDPEHMTMMKLRTYDGKYGYNTKDPLIQWLCHKEGLPARVNYGVYT